MAIEFTREAIQFLDFIVGRLITDSVSLCVICLFRVSVFFLEPLLEICAFLDICQFHIGYVILSILLSYSFFVPAFICDYSYLHLLSFLFSLSKSLSIFQKYFLSSV